MSFCKKQGKDEIIFVTKEDHEKPLKIQLPEDDDDQPGVILPNGDINWNCPCLGGMATGPCGVEFREAFSCFQYSKETPKGNECFEKFHQMQECMVQYPNLYPQPDNPMDFDEDENRVAKTTNVENSKTNFEEDENHTAKTTNVEVSETKPS